MAMNGEQKRAFQFWIQGRMYCDVVNQSNTCMGITYSVDKPGYSSTRIIWQYLLKRLQNPQYSNEICLFETIVYLYFKYVCTTYMSFLEILCRWMKRDKLNFNFLNLYNFQLAWEQRLYATNPCFRGMQNSCMNHEGACL